MPFSLDVNPIYTYCIGGATFVFLLVSLLWPSIIRNKFISFVLKHNCMVKDDGVNAHWNIWISIVLLLSAVDFISDINVLISSEWYNEALFWTAWFILFIQCVPYFLLLSKLKFNYAPGYESIISIVFAAGYESANYYTQHFTYYYQKNKELYWAIYGDGDNLGNAFFCLFLVFFVIVAAIIFFVVGVIGFVCLVFIDSASILAGFIAILILTLVIIIHVSLLVVLGFILYMLKLLPHSRIKYCKWWWNQFQEKPLLAIMLLHENNINDICGAPEKYVLILQMMIFCECIFETVPQFILQLYNASKLHYFSIPSICSIALSGLVIFSIVWKYFWYLCIDRYCRGNYRKKTCYTQLLATHKSFADGFIPSPDIRSLEAGQELRLSVSQSANWDFSCMWDCGCDFLRIIWDFRNCLCPRCISVWDVNNWKYVVCAIIIWIGFLAVIVVVIVVIIILTNK